MDHANLQGGGGHDDSLSPRLINFPDDNLLPKTLAELCATGSQHLDAFRTLGTNPMPVPLPPVKPEPAADEVKVDVDSLLASVRGAIGQSMAQVNQATTSQMNRAADDESAEANRKRNGLPPTAPSSQQGFSDMEDIEIPANLTQEERKKLKRRISNRECARRIRQRRQEQLSGLGGRIETLRMENAKLMMRLTEVMKCWHEIAGENRMLKTQLSAIKQGMGGGSNTTNTMIASLVNSSLGGLTTKNNQQSLGQGLTHLLKALGKDPNGPAGTTDVAALISGMVQTGNMNGPAAEALKALAAQAKQSSESALGSQGSSDLTSTPQKPSAAGPSPLGGSEGGLRSMGSISNGQAQEMLWNIRKNMT